MTDDDNGQEEKLRCSFDHHFCDGVRALETVIKHRPGILIGGVPIGESTDGQIVFQITCMHKSENGVACDDFFTAVCHRESVEQFCAELEEQYQRSAAIYLPASDPKLMKPRAVRFTTGAGSRSSVPMGCRLNASIVHLAGAIRSRLAETAPGKKSFRRSHSEIPRLVFDRY